MKIYIDINDFKNKHVISDALSSYSNIKGNIEIFLKADALEYPSLEDLKNVRRRNKFDSSDLKNITYFIKPYESFEKLKQDDNYIYFRIYDDTINRSKKLFLFYNNNSSIDSIINKYNKVKNYYLTHIDDKEISLGLIDKFNTNTDLYKSLKSINDFKEIVPLNNIFENHDDIILIDNEASFYIFSLLNYHSHFIKKEKDIKSYLSIFKPFGYHKIVDREVNLDTLFLYSTFQIEKNDKIYISINEDASPSQIIEFLTFLESIRDKTIDDID